MLPATTHTLRTSIPAKQNIEPSKLNPVFSDLVFDPATTTPTIGEINPALDKNLCQRLVDGFTKELERRWLFGITLSHGAGKSGRYRY